MLNEIDLGLDAIGITATGKVTAADVERVIDLLGGALRRRGPVHLFAEVVDFTGVEAGALRHGLADGMPLMSSLRRFGRVAIVSDRHWLRAIARTESAVLPGISYEVFPPEQRDHALAWVQGKIETPRPAGLRLLSAPGPGIFAFEINGCIDQAEVGPMLDAAERAAAEAAPGKLRILARVVGLEGFDADLFTDADFARRKRDLLGKVDRYALVGGPMLHGWALVADLMPGIDIRSFDSAQEAKARAWLSGARATTGHHAQ